MPRPSSHDQTRFAMLRVNHGFFDVMSQSAKTSRGSRFGGSLTLVPSGKNATAGGVLVGGAGDRAEALLVPVVAGRLVAQAAEFSGSQKTFSSFHSRVGL